LLGNYCFENFAIRRNISGHILYRGECKARLDFKRLPGVSAVRAPGAVCCCGKCSLLEILKMINTKADKLFNYTVIARLDDAIPLHTEEWQQVERLLNQISEFVPTSMLNNVTEAIISYADDQARRGYLLGQEDLVTELKKKASKIA